MAEIGKAGGDRDLRDGKRALFQQAMGMLQPDPMVLIEKGGAEMG